MKLVLPIYFAVFWHLNLLAVNHSMYSGKEVFVSTTSPSTMVFSPYNDLNNESLYAAKSIDNIPTLVVVNMVTNNGSNSAFAKAGDLITLSFTASEDLAATPTVTIAGQMAAVIQGADAQNWTATYTVPDIATLDQTQLPDGTVNFTIDFEDLNSNAGVQVITTTDSSEITIVRALPVVQTQNVIASLDANGSVSITPQQIDNGSLDAVGNAIPNISLNQSVFDCGDERSRQNNSLRIWLNDTIVVENDQLPFSNQPFTVSMWIKPNLALISNNDVIFDFNSIGSTGGLKIAHSSIFLSYTAGASNYNSLPNAINPTGWTHITFAYDSTLLKIYKDGSLFTQFPAAYNLNANSEFHLGNQADGSIVSRYGGNISRLVIYNRALDATAVTNLYNSTDLNVDLNGLIAFYPLYEDNGTMIDFTGNGTAITANGLNFSSTAINEAPVVSTNLPIPVRLTATDVAGNTASARAFVTVTDTSSPIINLNGSASENINLGSTYTDPGFTVADNCSIDTSDVIVGGDTVDTSTAGSYTITYTATDDAGNTATATRTVNVADATAPSLSNVTIASNNLNNNTLAGIGQTVTLTFLPNEPVTNVSASFGSNAMTITAPTTTGGNYVATYTIQSGDTSGANGFSISLQDTAGNATTVSSSTSGTSTITVDTNAPTFNELRITGNNSNNFAGFVRPGNRATLRFSASETVTINATFLGQAATSSFYDSDDDNWTVNYTIPEVSTVNQTLLPDGNLAFSLSITDAAGNTTTRTSTTDNSGLILDRTPPSVVTQQPTTNYTLGANNRVSIALNDVYVSASDANGISYVDQDTDTLYCSDVGTNNLTIATVYDNAGNRTDVSATITVVDPFAPVVTTDWPATQTVVVGQYPANPNPRATDNCGIVSRRSNLDDLDVSVPNTFTYTYTATDTAGNITTITRIVEVVQPEFVYENGTWTPNDPGLAANPSGVNDNVIIKDDVTISNNFLAKTLIIDPNTTLTLGSGVLIEISDLENSGILEARTAEIKPVTNNTIPTADRDWNSAMSHIGKLWGNCCFNLRGTYNIYESVYYPPTSGFFGGQLNVTNADFTFKASDSGYAVIDGNVNFSGEVVVEKYFDDIRAFRFVSSSVNSSSTIFENWQENGRNPSDQNYEPGYGIHITGAAGAANGFDATETNNSSMYLWDNIGQSWIAQSSTNQSTDILSAGNPSRLFIRGNRGVSLNSNTASSTTVLREKGETQWTEYSVADVSVNAGEFMLIGNPYINDVDLSDLMSTGNRSKISGAQNNFYFVWDPSINTRGAYRTYDRILDLFLQSATNSRFEKGILKPGQSAFFIASGAPSGQFVIPTPFANTSSGGGGRGGSETINNNVVLLSIKLFETTNHQQGGTELDAAMIKFEATGNNLMDQFDAVKFVNLDESLSRNLDGVNFFSIEGRAMPINGEILNLNISNYRHSNYTFEVPAIQLVSQKAFLEDLFTGSLTELSNTATTTYSFTVDSNDSASSASDRFRIIFEDVTLSAGDVEFNNTIDVYPNPVKEEHFYVNMGGIKGIKQVTVTNLLGQNLLSFITEESELLQVDLENIPPAMYFVNITQNARTKVVKLMVE